MATGPTKTWLTPKRLERGPEAAREEMRRWGQQTIDPMDDEPMDDEERATSLALFKSGKLKGAFSAATLGNALKAKAKLQAGLTPSETERKALEREREARRATWRVNRRRELAYKRWKYANALGAPFMLGGWKLDDLAWLAGGTVVAGLAVGLVVRHYWRKSKKHQVGVVIAGDEPSPNPYLLGTLALAVG